MTDKLVEDGATGVLLLMDWMTYPIDGASYLGFHGKLTVYSDSEAVGFEAKGHNTANWLARIEGETESLTVMGCQVRGFYQGFEPDQLTRQFKVLS